MIFAFKTRNFLSKNLEKQWLLNSYNIIRIKKSPVVKLRGTNFLIRGTTLVSGHSIRTLILCYNVHDPSFPNQTKIRKNLVPAKTIRNKVGIVSEFIFRKAAPV